MTDITDQPRVIAGGTVPRVPPLWLLGMLTFSSTVAMHIFVPALPVAAEDLKASIVAMQTTVSLYIFGLALGQLVYGPLSDRFGRRNTLMVGLVIFTISGVAATFAPTVHILIIARLCQALGGSAGLVLARAIVRDTSAPADAARRLALMNLIVTAGPALAPIIGAFMAPHFGWRSILVLLSLLGVVNFVMCWSMLPETRSGNGHSAAIVARHYGQLLRSPTFLAYALGGGCATTATYAFVTAAPFIFVRELHRPSVEVGIYLAILIFGIWSGSAMASRLLGMIGIKRVMVGGNALSVVAAFTLLGFVLTGVLTAPLAIGAMFFFAMGCGISAPAALTQAISINPQVIGSASGFYGFAQMSVGAACTALTAFGGDTALAAALVLVGAGVIAQICFWIALNRRQA